MSKSQILFTLTTLVGLGLAGAAGAQTYSANAAAAPLSEDGYKTAKKDADAQYGIDKGGCTSLSANAKDICHAQAKGRFEIAKADAEVAYKNTAKHREQARVARAEAAYHVAVEKCDDLAGNPKDVCVKEAKAALVAGKSEAKVDRVAADTRKDGAEKRGEARAEANEETRNAQFKVAIEKCDKFSGDAKTVCVANAKSDFGKS
jgi:hypothetical protein